jgi:nicotinate-nucleotide adenylyltransferase
MRFIVKGKLGNKLNLKKNKIGILGGSFDPAHKGHLAISKEAKKRFKLKKIIWAITKKNPFKKKSSKSLLIRIQKCKEIIKRLSFIEVRFYEDQIKSNKTINLINYFTKNKKNEIYFLMGADNLINFHKWHKWKMISQKCNIIVFDRFGYKKKSLNSTTYKRLNEKNVTFVEFNKVNISSSQLRNI